MLFTMAFEEDFMKTSSGKNQYWQQKETITDTVIKMRPFQFLIFSDFLE